MIREPKTHIAWDFLNILFDDMIVLHANDRICKNNLVDGDFAGEEGINKIQS